MCQNGVLVAQPHLHFPTARKDASCINLRGFFFPFFLNVRNGAVSQHMHLSNQMCLSITQVLKGEIKRRRYLPLLSIYIYGALCNFVKNGNLLFWQ